MKKSTAKTKPSLGLIQMGQVGEVAARVVAANLQTVLGILVDVLKPQGVPAFAFKELRRQYDAGLILKHLAQTHNPKYLRVLALTSVDLCIPVLTYVYGEAEVGGMVAVVSSFRLRHNDDGTTASLDRYYERLAKVALHEVAHTFSAIHCDNPGCLMHFSPKVQHLDAIEILFCERCEFMLREGIRQEMRRSFTASDA